MSRDLPAAQKTLICALFVSGAVLSLGGIDLVLPAIPALPDALGGDEATAQLVIAAYSFGVGAGLLVFGALGARIGRGRTFAAAMALMALASWACARAPTIEALIALRFLQGLASASAATFGPGAIRAMFTETGATKALGLLGSLESLAPALAPIVGLWLLSLGGWQVSFEVMAVLAALLAVAALWFRGAIPDAATAPPPGGYRRLLGSPVYLRYATTQALVLGGLLTFVFGAPAVFVRTMDGAVEDFIRMQVIGVSCFIIVTNLSGFLVHRFGAERIIWIGSGLAAISAAGLLIFALSGSRDFLLLAILFAPFNAGLGLRGPPGFLRAVIAGQGDDDRAASLMILMILGASAGGTALFAPFVGYGLPALTGLVLAMELAGLTALAVLPRLQTTPEPSHSGA
ncbi:MAG: MFS transporter [Pseudomonadota bacterium]